MIGSAYHVVPQLDAYVLHLFHIDASLRKPSAMSRYELQVWINQVDVSVIEIGVCPWYTGHTNYFTCVYLTTKPPTSRSCM